jgi:hypothetical protein
LQLINQIDDTGVPMVEAISRMAKRGAGNVDAAELHSVITTFQTEISRLLAAGPSMNGVISDTARREIGQMSPENMSAAQAKRIIARLYGEMDARLAFVNDAVSKSVGTASGGGAFGGQSPQGAPAANPDNDPLGIRK